MVEARLQELEIDLPSPSSPAANYVPFVKVGALVFISGQIPSWNGKLKVLGRVGDSISVGEGQEAAHLCALNILAQLKVACEGDLNRVVRCVRLGGFINCTDDFTDHPKVMNGASDLMVAVFGEKGKHARIAVGAPSLPLGIAVEVEGLFEVKV